MEYVISSKGGLVPIFEVLHNNLKDPIQLLYRVRLQQVDKFWLPR